ncbi:MAG: hypothetical protein GY722_17225 [bacterium]|nr:hypothetical protein [bacterium]
MDVEGLILDVTPADGEFDRDFLEKLGHPVLLCHGPEMGHLCPILKDGCEMVNSAHGVVFQLDLDRPQHRAILQRYQEVVSEDIPIVAVVQEGQRSKYSDLVSGIHVWETEPTASELDGFAAEVEAADWSRDT